jgi:regulator of sirC expression with transglutaminase-like and TPR domain
LALQGDRLDYDDPRNSFIDQILERRRGLPIALSILLIELARRRGLHLVGVGMPGHFLVADCDVPDLWIDAFAGGALLDVEGCRRRFEAVNRDASAFNVAMLSPIGTYAVLARVLANLERSYVRRGERSALRWSLVLRSLVPAGSLAERAAVGERLGAIGAFGEAAELFERLAVHGEPAVAEQFQRRARLLRARSN